MARNIESSPSQKTLGINRVVIFIIVAVSLLMTTVDTTIVATALETLQNNFETSVNWIGWIMTAYSFGFVLMLPLSAKLGDIFGSRRVFIISISVFTMASLLCGLTNRIEVLILLRVIQSLGAAGITPTVTAIIVDHFGSARDRAVSLFGSIFPIGVMLGPIFGGLIVTYWTWPWIFFVNVPLGIIVIITSFIFIPKDKFAKQERSKIDVLGLMWLGLGILTAMFAITYLGEEGAKLLSISFMGLILLSIICFTGFIWHINRVRKPFVAPIFVYGKGFGTVNFLNVLYTGMTQGVIALVPLYAANLYDIKALDASFLLISQGIAAVVLSTVVTMILRKTGYKPPFYVGSVLIVIGTALLAFEPMFDMRPYYWMMIATFLIGCGMGTISPGARNAGLQLAPEKSATIAALRSLCIQLGSIISIAVAAAIISSSTTPGKTQSYIYLGIAVFFALMLPVIRRVPEHKGSW